MTYNLFLCAHYVFVYRDVFTTVTMSICRHVVFWLGIETTASITPTTLFFSYGLVYFALILSARFARALSPGITRILSVGETAVCSHGTEYFSKNGSTTCFPLSLPVLYEQLRDVGI